MKYYINGKQVSEKQIKLEYYKEKYQFILIWLFIVGYLKRISSTIAIIAVLSALIIFSIIVILNIPNTPVFAEEKVEIIAKPQITKNILEEQQGYYNTIQWGRSLQPVQVFDTRVNYLIDQGLTLTEVIDITTLLTMECPRYDGKCINSSDIGPFQINRISHRGAYLKSKALFYNSKELFKYQYHYVKINIIDYLNNNFCGWQYTDSNEIRFKCLAKNYNGDTHIYSNGREGRYNYMILAWEKRKQVAKYIVNNYPLLKNH